MVRSDTDTRDTVKFDLGSTQGRVGIDLGLTYIDFKIDFGSIWGPWPPYGPNKSHVGPGEPILALGGHGVQVVHVVRVVQVITWSG